MQNKIITKTKIFLIGFLVSIVLISPTLAQNITFSADTTLTFSPDASPVLSVTSGSAADALIISGTTINVTVPANSSFTLKNSNGDLLTITPSGASSILEIDVSSSTQYTGGKLTGFAESSSGGAIVAHTVYVASNDNWFTLSAGGTAVSTYKSSLNGYITFNYTLGSPTTTLTVAAGQSSTGGAPVVGGGGGGGGSSASAPAQTVTQPTVSVVQTPVIQMSYSELLTKVLALLQAKGIKIPAGAEKQLKIAVQSGTQTTAEAEDEAEAETEDLTDKTPPALVKPLSIGSRGDDVKTLQQVLKDEGEDVYPEGLVTGYFGSLTRKAVQRFQEQYEIAKKGDAGYGYVGPKTRAKINEILGY